MASIAGIVWTCEIICTAHMAYRASHVAHSFYKSSKQNVMSLIRQIKVYGGDYREDDWVIIDPSQPEGWEDQEEAFPVQIQISEQDMIHVTHS